MIFYPQGYFSRISDINSEYIKQNNIKGFILDVDNTLIDYYKNMNEETIHWVEEMKKNGIKMCILSNSNKHKKVKEVAQKLDMEYSYFAMKPLRNGFKKAQRMLGLESSEIAVVGDQIFTDVIGANRMKMHSILVDPIEEKDIFVPLIKRPIENYIKKRFIKQKNKSEDNNNYCKRKSLDYLKKDVDSNSSKITTNEPSKKHSTKEERDVL